MPRVLAWLNFPRLLWTCMLVKGLRLLILQEQQVLRKALTAEAVIIWFSETGWAGKEVTKTVSFQSLNSVLVSSLTRGLWTSNVDTCPLLLNEEQVAEDFTSFWTLINGVDKIETGICKRTWWPCLSLLVHYSSLAETEKLQGKLKTKQANEDCACLK